MAETLREFTREFGNYYEIDVIIGIDSVDDLRVGYVVRYKGEKILDDVNWIIDPPQDPSDEIATVMQDAIRKAIQRRVEQIEHGKLKENVRTLDPEVVI